MALDPDNIAPNTREKETFELRIFEKLHDSIRNISMKDSTLNICQRPVTQNVF